MPSCKWPIELGNNDFQNQRTRIQVSKNSYVAKNQRKMSAGVTFWFPVSPTKYLVLLFTMFFAIQYHELRVLRKVQSYVNIWRLSSGLGYLLFHAVQDLNISCFRLPRWNMNWPNCLFPILLVFTSILLKSTEAFIIRRLRIRFGTIPTTRPPVVIPTECNEVIEGVCYQDCTGGGCHMECFNSEYYHSCYQSCNGEYLV